MILCGCGWCVCGVVWCAHTCVCFVLFVCVLCINCCNHCNGNAVKGYIVTVIVVIVTET
jgi:hypothetical protein